MACLWQEREQPKQIDRHALHGVSFALLWIIVSARKILGTLFLEETIPHVSLH
jgi:hypothetical protein